MQARYALYYVPHQGDFLHTRGSQWLGRDVYSSAPLTPSAIIEQGLQKAQISTEQWHTLRAEAQKYGLHATLKAPFHLAQEQDEAALLQAVQDFATKEPVFTMPRLTPQRIGSFFALTYTQPHAPLQHLAQNCVRHFEPFRAPLTAQAKAKRLAKKLSPRQLSYLEEYGYPYIFEDFRFHITLCQASHQEAHNVALQSFFQEFFSAHLLDRTCAALHLCKSDAQGVFTVIYSAPLQACV